MKKNTPKLRTRRSLGILCVFVFLIAAGLLLRAMPGSDEDLAVEDSVSQFELTGQSGSAMNRCVHAGLMKEAYMHAKNGEAANRWASLEKTACSAVGFRSSH